MSSPLPIERFLATLDIVFREGRQLEFSRGRLFASPVDAEWVSALEHQPEKAERLEAFVSRFGRMQDTIADRLLPRWLLALAERPGSLIETLNRAERLGVLRGVNAWLEARQLRNRLIHEYMTDPQSFAADLNLTDGFATMLLETYGRIRADAIARLSMAEDRLPPSLSPRH